MSIQDYQVSLKKTNHEEEMLNGRCSAPIPWMTSTRAELPVGAGGEKVAAESPILRRKQPASDVRGIRIRLTELIWMSNSDIDNR